MPSALEILFLQYAESLDVSREPTFADVLALVHESRYTGRLVLHCHNGVPRQAELGQPVKIELRHPKT